MSLLYSIRKRSSRFLKISDRHNAIDRVIGYGLRNRIDFSRTFIVSSGRISSEMVRKCLIANIPMIISRSATTTLSVEIAEKTGLTIVGFVRAGKMNVYSRATANYRNGNHKSRITISRMTDGAGIPGRDPRCRDHHTRGRCEGVQKSLILYHSVRSFLCFP